MQLKLFSLNGAYYNMQFCKDPPPEGIPTLM